MKTLGIHSAGLGCSVALIEDGRVLSIHHDDAVRSQAEALMPMVLEVLAAAEIRLTAIDRFGVTVGPGSFTGLRIGIATVRGMMLATGRPGIEVSSFEAAAYGAADDEIDDRLLLAVVESRRAELFVQAFDSTRKPAGDPEALSPDQIAERYGDREIAVAGDGAGRLKPLLAGLAAVRFCRAVAPEAVAVTRLAAIREPSGSVPRPVYLRQPDVTFPGGPR